MSLDLFDHKLLIQFEQNRRERNDSVASFASDSELAADSSVLLELIALDMEIRLSQGEQFSTDSYYFDFPHLVHQIPEIYHQVIREFKRGFCPVVSRLGQLPCMVDGYLIEKEISRGGMGVVYLASKGTGKQKYAFKLPFFKTGNDFNESKILERTNHPNICKLVASGTWEDFSYICMELISGGTVKEKLQRLGRFDLLFAVQLAIQIAEGLDHIHRQGVVHFDINSSNVVIGNDETPILIDFGLSVAVSVYGPDELVVNSFGTPDYMAPEMYDQKFGKPGPASDVYGLGVLMYEMITGLRPFTIKSALDVEAAFKYPPSRPSDFDGLEIDSKLEGICLAALSKNVADRIASTEQLIEELQGWIDQQSQASPLQRRAKITS